MPEPQFRIKNEDDRIHVRVELNDRPIRDYIVAVSEDGKARIDLAPMPDAPVMEPDPISDRGQMEKPKKAAPKKDKE